MSIWTNYSLSCTRCSIYFRDSAGSDNFESLEDLDDSASAYGWQIGIRVKNGSDWDFCPKCYNNHVNGE